MEAGNFNIENFIFNESFQRYVIEKTQADTIYWESWINKNPSALAAMESAKEILTYVVNRQRRPTHLNIQEQVYAKLQHQIYAEAGVSEKTTGRILPAFYKYAAAFIFVAGCAAALLLFKNREKSDPDVVSQYLEVIVPKGQRSQLILPDGTKVWLNSGSVFKYPGEFLKKNRDVFLEGEAFFDVKHHDNIPFVVHLKDKLSIRVLGTEFNVKNYPDEKVIETTLIKGSIKLIREDNSNSTFAEIELKPNEKAVFQKQSRSINISRLLATDTNEDAAVPIQSITREKLENKIEPITAWKKEVLVFYNESFEEIAYKNGEMVWIKDRGC